MKMKRILALMLALMMCSLALFSCKKKEEAPAETTQGTVSTGEGTQEVIEYDENGYQKDKLGTMDFNAREINICGWSNIETHAPEFGVEKLGADIVSDAAYLKNIAVETRLNVKLKFDTMDGWTGPGTAEAGQAQLTRVQNAAGTDEIDIIGSYSWNPCTFMVNGYITNLNNMPYLDLNAPWWNGSIVDKSSIYGNVYYATGDIAPSLIRNTYAVFFNKDVASNNHLGDMYELYENGTWTLDKMIELSKLVSSDTGVIGTKEKTDKFGFVTFLTATDAFYQGSELMLIENASDGSFLLSDDFTSSKTQSLLQKLINFNKTEACLIDNDQNIYNATWKQGNSLFVLTDFAMVEDWVDSNAKNFGILPMPKYDGDQESYHTLVGFYFTMYCVPTSLSGDEAVGATLECMASESYRRVTPAFYENLIQTRYSSTVQEAMMFDAVRDCIVVDSGRIFQGHLGWLIWGQFRRNLRDLDTDWASASAGIAPSIQTKVTSLNQLATVLG